MPTAARFIIAIDAAAACTALQQYLLELAGLIGICLCLRAGRCDQLCESGLEQADVMSV